MSIVLAKCTNCSASLNVDSTKDAAICEFCGSPYIVEKAINNYSVVNNISGSVVNIYGSNSIDFIIRAGFLEKYTGASTEVVIPDGVKTIGESAFSDCSEITSISLPDGVAVIERLAFKNCSGLNSVTMPNSIREIGYSAFRNCSGLTSLTIPDNVTRIENVAFSECRGLASLTIPEGVTTIGEFAFSDCSGLTSIAIPDSVTTIGESAFKNCSGLARVIVPEHLGDRVIEGAFKGTPYFAERKKQSCYLTTACIKSQPVVFDDDCYELTTLRSFRDTYLKSNYPEDIETYYSTAPAIVEAINEAQNASDVWAEVYRDLVESSVKYIENQKLEDAYQCYKSYSLSLMERFLN